MGYLARPNLQHNRSYRNSEQNGTHRGKSVLVLVDKFVPHSDLEPKQQCKNKILPRKRSEGNQHSLQKK